MSDAFDGRQKVGATFAKTQVLAGAALICGFIGVVAWFGGVDFYHRHFFDTGPIVAADNLVRMVFVVIFSWLIYAPGAAAAALIMSADERAALTPPERAVLGFGIGVGHLARRDAAPGARRIVLSAGDRRSVPGGCCRIRAAFCQRRCRRMAIIRSGFCRAAPGPRHAGTDRYNTDRCSGSVALAVARVISRRRRRLLHALLLLLSGSSEKPRPRAERRLVPLLLFQRQRSGLFGHAVDRSGSAGADHLSLRRVCRRRDCDAGGKDGAQFAVAGRGRRHLPVLLSGQLQRRRRRPVPEGSRGGRGAGGADGVGAVHGTARRAKAVSHHGRRDRDCRRVGHPADRHSARLFRRTFGGLVHGTAAMERRVGL